MGSQGKGDGGMERTDLEELISDFISRRVWAVVGVSQDPAKYGNRIFRSLLASGTRSIR